MVKAIAWGVPLARHAGERRISDHSRDRRGAENQRVLYRARAAADATGAGDRRTDAQGAATLRTAARSPDEGVPGGVASARNYLQAPIPAAKRSSVEQVVAV